MSSKRSMRRAAEREKRGKRPRRWSRGGHVVEGRGPYGGPMNVLIGGRDAPLSRRARLWWIAFGLVVVGLVVLALLYG